MDSMVYSEKYLTSVPFSSRGFGGKALDGLVVVTATGLLGAVVQSNSEETGGKPIVASEKMFAMRNHIVHADLAYSTGEGLLIPGLFEFILNFDQISVNRPQIQLECWIWISCPFSH